MRTSLFLLSILLGLAGCVNVVSRSDPAAGTAPAGKVRATGRINYVVDGIAKSPYGAFRPAWPAPFASAVQLETGEVFALPAVDNRDGAFAWNVPPGSYVITRIGHGTIVDETFIAWPRVAFRIPSGASEVYLGHLVLEGTSYSETFRYSTGRESASKGIRYRIRVVDERAGEQAGKALMFHDPGMPIGVQLQDAWDKSRAELIERLFKD